MSIDWIIGVDAVLFVIGVPFLVARAVARIPMLWLARLAITCAVQGTLLGVQLATQREFRTGAPLIAMLIAVGWPLGSPWKTLLQRAELQRH